MKRVMILTALLAAPLLATQAGCVTSKRYNDALAELSELRATTEGAVAEKDRIAQERDEAVNRLEGQIQTLKDEIALKDAELARQQEAVDRLTSEKAAILKDKAALEAPLAELEQAMATAQKVPQLEAQIRDKEALGEELRLRLTAEQTRSDALQRRVAGLDAQIEKLNAEKSALVKDRSALEASQAEMEKALGEMSARQAEANARLQEYRDLLKRFEPLVSSGQLKVKMVDGRMVVELPTDVLFASGSATLSRDGADAIRQVGAVLATIPDKSFQVEGHTDNVPISTERFPSNWELASARAIAVVNELVKGGMKAASVSAASYAAERPVAPNTTAEGKAANRRIEIAVVPDLSSLPGFQELNRMVEDQAPAKK